jgi:hypothetical protein
LKLAQQLACIVIDTLVAVTPVQRSRIKGNP